MAHFYLIRHATNDLVGKAIAGRAPGVHLNDEGRRQADRLASRLARAPIAQLYSSPLDRARETALPLAKVWGLELHIAPEICEIQFGDWTGQPIAELEKDPAWQQWNRFRSGSRVPNGETMLEIQARFVGFVQKLWAAFPNENVALVSHGDPIRSVLLYFLGLSLDSVHRLELSPASVSILSLSDSGPQVLLLNGTESS